MDLPELKTIDYRGGVVSFRIPSHWNEEYEENGGGTFYDDTPNSGTLRLNILTFKAPAGKLPASGYDDFISKTDENGVKIVRLPSGDGMKMYQKQAEEAGEFLQIYYWEIAHCAPPQQYYLAIFSWTILATLSGNQKFEEEIQMVTRELEQIIFHPDLGSL